MKYIIIFSFFFVSCSRKELIEKILISDNEPKLAIYSLIAPDKWIYVNVRTTLPVGQDNNANIDLNSSKDSTFDLVSGARVAIRNLTKNYEKLLPEIEEGVYGLPPNDFLISAGERYALTVNYKNHRTYSECKIPSRAAIIDKITATPLKMAYDTVINNSKLFISFSSSDLLMTGKDISTNSEVFSYARYIERETTQKDGKLIKRSDPAFGKPKIAGGEFIFYGGVALNENDVSQKVSIQVLTVYPIFSDFVYNYYNRLEQKATLQENPFRAFRGITPINTNIQNGYGIFAGYLISPPKQITVSK